MPDAAEAASAPLLEISGARATIRLNRPKHLNRLQSEDLGDLMKLFDRIEADPAIRVLVLTGTGRAFSAGYDLNSVADRATSATAQPSAGSAFEVVVDRLEDLGVPTICRLNGGVYGGSTDLALACDFRIGVDTAEMFMPAARLGLHYYKSGIARYVSRLGVDNAKKLFLTAQKITAPEMLRIGYLTAMVPLEMLDEEVDKLANILAGNAPLAMRGMKRAINEFARGKLDEEAADLRHRESMRGDEIKEGIKAFAEKRAPKFSGNSGALRPHRADLLETGILRKRLVALAVDRIDRDASLGIGMHAPAEALAEPRCPHARLPLGEEFVAGKTALLLRRLRTELPAVGGGREYHVVRRVFVGRFRNHPVLQACDRRIARAGRRLLAGARRAILRDLDEGVEAVGRVHGLCHQKSVVLTRRKPRRAAPPSRHRPR